MSYHLYLPPLARAARVRGYFLKSQEDPATRRHRRRATPYIANSAAAPTPRDAVAARAQQSTARTTHKTRRAGGATTKENTMATFAVEYAKSGRSTCKGTKELIPKGALRLAKVTEREHGDKTISMAAWYLPVSAAASRHAIDATPRRAVTDRARRSPSSR